MHDEQKNCDTNQRIVKIVVLLAIYFEEVLASAILYLHFYSHTLVSLVIIKV